MRETSDVDESSSGEAGAAGTAVAEVSDGPDGHGVDPDRTTAAAPGQAGPASQRRSAGGSERHLLPGALGLRLAHAAQRLNALADGLLVVSPAGAVPAVPHFTPDRPKRMFGRNPLLQRHVAEHRPLMRLSSAHPRDLA